MPDGEEENWCQFKSFPCRSVGWQTGAGFPKRHLASLWDIQPSPGLWYLLAARSAKAGAGFGLVSSFRSPVGPWVCSAQPCRLGGLPAEPPARVPWQGLRVKPGDVAAVGSSVPFWGTRRGGEVAAAGSRARWGCGCGTRGCGRLAQPYPFPACADLLSFLQGQPETVQEALRFTMDVIGGK